uniref:Uncharacterized protein n=1 Tax=Rangifer tarandus platyrhynchus TaxID=3082113 RepID=A0ACB0FLU7_RANTA|nr:unnamed protein product [Rangifer tarandus platyrhynchus]
MKRANGNPPAPPTSLPPRRGPLSTNLGVVFLLFVLKSRATFTFKGPPTCFPVRVRAPAAFSIRPGILPAHFLPLPGTRRHPGRGGWTRGAPASPPPAQPLAPEGVSGAGLGPAKGENHKRLSARRRGHKEGITRPRWCKAGWRAIDKAGLSPPALSSRFCRDRHGASWGSRGAAGTPGALPPPAAEAERSAALTLNSPGALWLHSIRAELLEV